MNSADIVGQYASDQTLMERVGLRYLRRHNPRESTEVHRWSEDEVAGVRDAERRATRWAAVSGAISGTLLAVAEIALRAWLVDDTETDDWQRLIPFWSWYMGVVVLVSGTEIIALYWLVLRAVARLSAAAGLSLAPQGRDQLLAQGLCRAALDFPNPRSPIYGIDPYARVTRGKLLLYAVAYRLKVGATSFVVRVVLRRVFARAAIRFLVPLLAVPVFAVWNAMIIRWAMRSARVRAAGPVAVQELAAQLREQAGAIGSDARRMMLNTVAEVIMRSGDGHPGFALLLEMLLRELELSPQDVEADWEATRRGVGGLSEEEQQLLLTVATAAVLVSGRLPKAERELLQELHGICGVPFHRDVMLDLHHAFLDGQGLSRSRLEALRGNG